jgi:hypothetical protein
MKGSCLFSLCLFNDIIFVIFVGNYGPKRISLAKLKNKDNNLDSDRMHFCDNCPVFN